MHIRHFEVLLKLRNFFRQHQLKVITIFQANVGTGQANLGTGVASLQTHESGAGVTGMAAGTAPRKDSAAARIFRLGESARGPA